MRVMLGRGTLPIAAQSLDYWLFQHSRRDPVTQGRKRQHHDFVAAAKVQDLGLRQIGMGFKPAS